MNAIILNQQPKRLDQARQRSPFLLENEAEYQIWRRRKCDRRVQFSAQRVFSTNSQGFFDSAALEPLQQQVEAHGFVLFESSGVLDKAAFLALNRQLGLIRLDANPGADEDRVTALRVVAAPDPRARYIPYTNRALNWHTDGYYNPRERQIGAFALYCVNPAARGGGNFLFDHEWMYLRLRDQAPDLLAALMHDDLMQIPANEQDHRVQRKVHAGPVFAIDPASGKLQMRYSSRAQHIVWKRDPRSRRALKLVREILRDSEAVIELRLNARQGLICNNMLHGRVAFEDALESRRLLYRARYYDAIDLEPVRLIGA